MYNAINNRYEMANGGVYNEPTRNNSIARLQEAFDYTSTSGVAFGTTDTLTNNATYKSLFFTEPTADALLLPVSKGTYYRMYLNYYVELETLEEEELNLNIRVDYYDADKVYISSGVPFNITNKDHKIDIQAIGDALDYPANARYIFIGGQNNGDANITVRFRHASVRVSTTKEEEPAEGLLKTSDNKLYVLLGNANGGTPAPVPPTNPTYETVSLVKSPNPTISFNNNNSTTTGYINLTDTNLGYYNMSSGLASDHTFYNNLGGNASRSFRMNSNYIYAYRNFYMISGWLDMNNNKIQNVPNPTAGDEATNKTYVDNEISSKCVQLTGNQTVAGNKTFSGITSIEASLNMNNNRIENVATPTIGTDGANKAYVDSVAGGSSFNNNINMNGNDITDVGEIQADKLTLIRPDGSLVSFWIEQLNNETRYVNMSGGSSSDHAFFCNNGGNPTQIFSITNNEIKTIRELNMSNKRIEQLREATTQYHAPNYGQLLERTAKFQSYKIALNDVFTANTWKTFVMDTVIPVESYQTGTYILSATINLVIDGPGQTTAVVFGRMTVPNSVSGENNTIGRIFMEAEAAKNYGQITFSKVMTISASGNFPTWNVAVKSNINENIDVEITYKMDRISN